MNRKFLHNFLHLFFVVLVLLSFATIVAGGFDARLGHFTIHARIIKNLFRFIILPALLILWIKTTNIRQLVKNLETVVLKKHGIVVLISIAFLLLIWIKVSQHYTFRTGAFDLSMYDYALSNTLKGKFMYTPWLGRNYFSEHFAPILLLLLPFYLIYDTPVILVVTQAVAVVLSMFPLYKLAKEEFSALISCCLVVAYLNYSHLLTGFMFDFHMEIFIPLCLFAVFLYLRKNTAVPYFIFLILALGCKEDMPIYLSCLGVYACLVEKKWKLGIPTMLISVVWAIIAWKIVIPLSYPDGVKSSHFLLRWSQYGQTHTQIALGLLTHPSSMFGKLFFEHVWSLLRPLGLIPLVSPATFLLSLPSLIINVTSTFEVQKNLGAHYALPIVPFLFIAGILGLKRLCKRFPQKRQILLFIVCYYLLIMNTHLYPILFKSFAITKHDVTGHRIIKTLPEKATIAAQTPLIPHLRKTQNISLLPEGLDSEYILFDTQRFRWPMLEDDEYHAVLQKCIDKKDYALIFNEEGFYVFKRKK